jgi:hypothetical protein
MLALLTVILSVGAARTVTGAVASAKFGAVARMVTEPGFTPVTGMVTFVVPAAMVNVAAETVAMVVSLEVTVKAIPPAGAGPERVRVRFPVLLPDSERFWGERALVAVTCTDWLPEL